MREGVVGFGAGLLFTLLSPDVSGQTYSEGVDVPANSLGLQGGAALAATATTKECWKLGIKRYYWHKQADGL